MKFTFGLFSLRIVSVELPPGARKFGVQFRWWQPYHSGRGQDVWAVDEISMTSVLFNIISLDFSNVLDVTQSLGFYLGNVQPYCQHDWTLRYCFTCNTLTLFTFTTVILALSQAANYHHHHEPRPKI